MLDCVFDCVAAAAAGFEVGYRKTAWTMPACWLSVQPHALRRGDDIELRQQFVARALQANAGVLNLQARFFHFGPRVHGIGDEAFHLADRLLFRHVDGAGWDHAESAQGRVGGAALGEHGLDEKLLFKFVGTGISEILPRGSYSGLGAGQFNRSERSLFDGDAVVFVQPVGEGKRFLFHLDVLNEADKIVI